jgi:intracellular sulfur oxidation DsrE/DsrF family protein
MKEQNQYSDEHISAYIDGELDNDERARLLFDEQRDTELAQRVSESRALKEKVQLAYSDITHNSTSTNSFNCADFSNKYRSLVAGIGILIITAALLIPTIKNHHEINLAKNLIKTTETISSDKINVTVGDNKQVIINLSQYQPESFDSTIDHIEALLLQHKNDKLFSVEIVANKNGLKALDKKTSIHANRISLLAKRYENLDVIACVKSMTNLAESGNPIQLMKDILLSPSAAEQVAKRMSDGWMFLKL